MNDAFVQNDQMYILGSDKNAVCINQKATSDKTTRRR